MALHLWTASRDKTLKAWLSDSVSFSLSLTHREGGSPRSINALACNAEQPSSTILFGGDDRTGRLLTY